MKNLILVRHAKSSWKTPVNDIDRPLAKRGITDAHLISMTCQHFLPKSFIICSSTAARASSTAMIFAQNLSYPLDKIVYSPDLYTFEERDLEKFVKACDNHYHNIILFGHNEAITNIVNKFGDMPIDKVPTSGFVLINFNSYSWESISKGKTQKTIFPRELKIA